MPNGRVGLKAMWPNLFPPLNEKLLEMCVSGKDRFVQPYLGLPNGNSHRSFRHGLFAGLVDRALPGKIVLPQQNATIGIEP